MAQNRSVGPLRKAWWKCSPPCRWTSSPSNWNEFQRRRHGGATFLLDALSRLRFDEQNLSALDPAFAQIDPEPAVAVLFVKAAAGSRTELLEVVLRPGPAHVG